MKPVVSILLPTYNEVENIVPLIKAIDKAVSNPKEIIVVDDNSPDGTSTVVSKFIATKKISSVRLETRYKNRGLTNSIQHGINVSKGIIIVWMDCDFSMPPEVIPTLLKKIEEGHDVAVGSRFIKGGKAKSESQRDSIIGILLSNWLNLGMYLLLQNEFHDYTSGFVAVKKKVFEKISLRGDYGEYFIDFIVKVFSYKYSVCEVPYICAPRMAGESKTGQNLWDYVLRGRKYLGVVFQLLWEKYIAHKLP